MIYLDNAATSWPKPEEVYTVMERFLREAGANPGRAGHRMAREAERMILETRTRLARFFGAPVPERVAFTLNATDSLNIALKGLLKPGDHVITSSLEHNSVARPLNRLAALGVEVTRVANDSVGLIDPEAVRKAIKRNTQLIVINHASNVLGTVQPIRELGRIAKENGLLLVVDAAQSAGHLPIDVEKDGIDILACSGHKGLLGPPGVGILVLKDEIPVSPWREGGTGSRSESPVQPEAYPYRLESGTPNTVGIAALGAGVAFIEKVGLAQIRAHEDMLVNRLLEGLRSISGVKIYGPADASLRTGIVSFNLAGWEPVDAGAVLDHVYGIAARTGLHCAPWAHEAIGTFPAGCIRFSTGYFNTVEEIDQAVAAVRELVRSAA
ncbi:MAG: aminotransferase class V-fold PLP-dependent enzyme [Clostridia bacterium]|nr:aminotransferase class V-fold PLP-dependent enzyme [Clostridia bacterium]